MRIVRVVVFESEDEDALRKQLARSLADGQRELAKGIRTLIVTTVNELPVPEGVAAASRSVADTYPPEAPDHDDEDEDESDPT